MYSFICFNFNLKPFTFYLNFLLFDIFHLNLIEILFYLISLKILNWTFQTFFFLKIDYDRTFISNSYPFKYKLNIISKITLLLSLILIIWINWQYSCSFFLWWRIHNSCSLSDFFILSDHYVIWLKSKFQLTLIIFLLEG
jgi:hypothetical protein